MNGKTGPKATNIRVIVYDHNIPSVYRNARLSSACGIAHAFFNLPHLVQVVPYMFRLKTDTRIIHHARKSYGSGSNHNFYPEFLSRTE